jgi:hypothetical protein
MDHLLCFTHFGRGTSQNNSTSNTRTARLMEVGFALAGTLQI